MEKFQRKSTFKGLHQVRYESNLDLKNPKDFSGDHIYILLHGYSETGFKIYKRLGHKLANHFGEKALILAPNGLYPLPKAFPLGKRPVGEDLLMGYAWYFFDQTTNEFLIDYQIPMNSLKNFIADQNPNNLPVTIIGYSQGGYLAPFVGMGYENTHEVIGINCSFREDLMKEIPSFPLSLFQGAEDKIIETDLAKERFDQLKKRGSKGTYKSIKNEDHKLSPHISDEVLTYLLSN